jgi:hypothetical protein
MNLRERHSHTFKDPRRIERCDAAVLLAAGDALAEAAEVTVGRFLDTTASLAGVHVAALNNLRDAIALWKKVTDGK